MFQKILLLSDILKVFFGQAHISDLYKTYGSKTYRDGQAELQLHDAVRRWSRALVGLAAPGFHVSVEEFISVLVFIIHMVWI